MTPAERFWPVFAVAMVPILIQVWRTWRKSNSEAIAFLLGCMIGAGALYALTVGIQPQLFGPPAGFLLALVMFSERLTVTQRALALMVGIAAAAIAWRWIDPWFWMQPDFPLDTKANAALWVLTGLLTGLLVLMTVGRMSAAKLLSTPYRPSDHR